MSGEPSDNPGATGGLGRETLLARFDGIRQFARGGRRAPHKPLLLLYALARLKHCRQTQIRFNATEAVLQPLLRSYGPWGGGAHVSYPYSRLVNDGLWHLPDRTTLVDAKGNVRERLAPEVDAPAGFAPAADRPLGTGWGAPGFYGGKGEPTVGLTAASSARGTRWGKALSYLGGIVVLAGGAACTSPMPDAGPQDAVARADGPYIATRPEAFEGKVVGLGHCVDFVKAAAGVPHTAAWQEGVEVRRNPHMARGTAIATFESDGSYTNESGNHAAIYLYQDDRGIWVYDQWQGQPVHKRLIRFDGGRGAKWGSKSNDGRRFAVIE